MLAKKRELRHEGHVEEGLVLFSLGMLVQSQLQQWLLSTSPPEEIVGVGGKLRQDIGLSDPSKSIRKLI